MIHCCLTEKAALRCASTRYAEDLPQDRDPNKPSRLFSMKFCSDCAHPVVLSIPPDDTRLRFVCPNCGAIHYQNPKLVIGTIPVWERDGVVRVMLCKRDRKSTSLNSSHTVNSY